MTVDQLALDRHPHQLSVLEREPRGDAGRVGTCQPGQLPVDGGGLDPDVDVPSGANEDGGLDQGPERTV